METLIRLEISFLEATFERFAHWTEIKFNVNNFKIARFVIGLFVVYTIVIFLKDKTLATKVLAGAAHCIVTAGAHLCLTKARDLHRPGYESELKFGLWYVRFIALMLVTSSLIPITTPINLSVVGYYVFYTVFVYFLCCTPLPRKKKKELQRSKRRIDKSLLQPSA